MVTTGLKDELQALKLSVADLQDRGIPSDVAAPLVETQNQRPTMVRFKPARSPPAGSAVPGQATPERPASPQVTKPAKPAPASFARSPAAPDDYKKGWL